MLTATYSLGAIAIEQKQALHCLARTRESITALRQNPPPLDSIRVEQAVSGMSRFDHFCHERKLEKYVIPTVRGASIEVAALVRELESLSGTGLTLLGAVGNQVQTRFERQANQARELCRAMDAYCDCLRQRLMREEELLFPMVRRLLSVEDWFTLAAKFLGDEQRRHAAHLRAALMASFHGPRAGVPET